MTDGQQELQDQWLTLAQAAEYAQVHPITLGRECRAGKLKFARVGGRKNMRLRRSWVDRWLEVTATDGQGGPAK